MPRYQFSSKEYDGVVELNYYGYRFYISNMGRWLTRDPIGNAGGDNLYRFVVNSPVNKKDLLGLIMSSSDCTDHAYGFAGSLDYDSLIPSGCAAESTLIEPDFDVRTDGKETWSNCVAHYYPDGWGNGWCNVRVKKCRGLNNGIRIATCKTKITISYECEDCTSDSVVVQDEKIETEDLGSTVDECSEQTYDGPCDMNYCN